jgi:hypothetical protein
MATPRLLARGGPDLLVVDVNGGCGAGGHRARWARCACRAIRWDESVVDIQTFVINPDQGHRIYVPYPASSQILRYDPTADGGGFSARRHFISEER